MYSPAKGQLDIQCIDCHGTVAQRATPGVDGIFRTKLGTALDQLERDDEGTWLTTKRTGERLKVTQITDSIAARCEGDAVNFDPICRAMAPHESGFSHTEEMECWTCHTRWRMNCLGCHVTYSSDRPRERKRNHQTGEYMDSLVAGDRQFYDIDLMFLGTNRRGKIDTMCPSMQFFFTKKVGTTVTVDQKPRRTADGRVGFGWMPNNQHTIGYSRGCTDCHPKDDGSNEKEVRARFGYGWPEKEYWVAARTGEPDPDPANRRGFRCTDDDGCPENMRCLNPCPENMNCERPSYVVRRCATVCSSHNECDAPAICARQYMEEGERRVKVLKPLPDGAPERPDTGLCVYDLTQMLDEEGNAISPFAHEGTGPVSKPRFERAWNHRVP